MGKLRTTLQIMSGAYDGDAHEVEIEVTYVAQRGCQATYTQPGEDDTIYLNTVSVVEQNGTRIPADWLIGLLENDAEILAQIGQDWAEDQIEARERAAEERAELAREEGALA